MVEGMIETRIEAIPINELQVDHSYQRGLDSRRCARLADELDPDLFGIIHVSERADGSFWIIDGQHRHGAVVYLARTDPSWSNQKIDCKVYRGLTIAQEAFLFRKLNEIAPVRPVDKYLAGLRAGMEPEVSISRILGELGLRVGKNRAVGVVTCVGSLRMIYTGYRMRNVVKGATHEHALRLTLMVLLEAFDSTPVSMQGDLVLGVGQVCLAYYRRIKRDVLVRKLMHYPGGAAGVVRDAKGMASIKQQRICDAVASLVISHYNKGKREDNPGWLEQLRKG